MSPGGDRTHPGARAASGLIGLEPFRLELVALEQLVELGAVALRELRRLRDVARVILRMRTR